MDSCLPRSRCSRCRDLGRGPDAPYHEALWPRNVYMLSIFLINFLLGSVGLVALIHSGL